MTMQLILIRHGLTEFNRARIFQGQSDSRLTEEGLSQARLLAPAHPRPGPPAPVSTPPDLGPLPPDGGPDPRPGPPRADRTDPGLRERGYGLFEGLRKEEIPGLHPEVWSRYESGDPDYAVPGGESARDFRKRAVEAVDAHRRPASRGS